MAKRNLFRIKVDSSGRFYGYLRTGKYLREKIATRHGCTGKYRYKKLKNGDRLLFCVTRKKGKKGGKTKLLAILRPINKNLNHYRKRKPAVYKALKKARKIKKKS